MGDDNILKAVSIVFVLLSSVVLLYCIVSLYKIKGSLLWIKNRTDLLWLIVFTGVFSVLITGYALYTVITGHFENTVLVASILFAGAIFVYLTCRILTFMSTVFDKSQQLVEESISDESMGIYSRAYFVLRLKEEFIMAKRHNINFSIMVVAVDYFEKIRSSYGREYTGKFIKSFSEFVKHSVRETDIVARLEGEEIIILLQNTGIEGARTAARKIQNAVENKTFYIETGNEINQIMIACTVSVGVATYATSLKNSDQLIEQVDVALFKARDRGCNQVAIYGE